MAIVTKEHFMQHGGWIKGKNWNKNKYLVWIATVLSLWVARNKIVFEGKSDCLHDIVFNVMLLSWSWFSLRVKRRPSNAFDDWVARPLLCMM
jgi:hypothetical protein